MTSPAHKLRTCVVVAVLSSACLASCVSVPSDMASHNEKRRALLTTYVEALRSGDYSGVRFAPDLSLEGPLSRGTIQGERAVKTFLVPVSQGAKEIRVDRFVVEGDFAVIVATLETKTGTVVPFCELVQFRGNEIVSLRPYFDPRQLLQ